MKTELHCVLPELEDLVGETKIFSDKYYLFCILQASLSKGPTQRYGSLLVKDGEIIGEGYTRSISNKGFSLERKIRQGSANHAPIEALNDAFIKGNENKIEGSEVFEAGYFTESGKLYLKENYTCTKCPPILKKYGVINIYTPMPGGWIKKTVDEALVEGKKFSNLKIKGATFLSRCNAAIGDYYLWDVGKLLKHLPLP